MPTRAALPVLLVALFALPVHADLVMPNRCNGHEEGTPCGEGATCRLVKCWRESHDDEDPSIGRPWDCLQCMTPEQAEHRQRALQTAREYEAQALRRNRLLGLAPWALGAVCLFTLVWYQIRREHFDSEPPSPPSA